MNEADFRSAQVVISSFATAAQLTIPIVIAVVGYFVHRSVARLEDSLEQKRELIRRRIELYEKLGPCLNEIFCGTFLVGAWREIPPPKLITTKSATDQLMHINLAFWSLETLRSYHAFMGTCFSTYNGPLTTAVLRADPARYKEEFGDRWTVEWEHLFMNPSDRANWKSKHASELGKETVSFRQDLVMPAYDRLLASLGRDMGNSICGAGFT